MQLNMTTYLPDGEPQYFKASYSSSFPASLRRTSSLDSTVSFLNSLTFLSPFPSGKVFKNVSLFICL